MRIKNYLTLIAYTLVLGGCNESPIIDEQVNIKASLPPGLNFTEKDYKVISLMINKKRGTMSTLYGNDIALKSARSGTEQYPKGTVMTLVTWQQQPNAYWYGNKIPGTLLSLETVSTDQESGGLSYKRYEGEKLLPKKSPADSLERLSFILDRKPSIMP